MADLLSHGAAAVLVKASTRWAYAPVFVAGTIAPDLFSRVPSILLGWVHTEITALPALLTYGWEPLHQPIGMILLATFLTLLFEAAIRKAVFLNLLGGMALHMVLDMLQYHFGAGYLLAFPLSDWAYEFGWIGSEDSVWAAPVLVGLAVWAARKQTHTTPTDQNTAD